ncbi:dockerin type I domain-containing protein [Paenibacillus sp. TSA_86.1]|uniref:dockerin type I domain-containing protein n=1 Tax=Paenibacillus sp. TSA_86.1 TaxID=3415649 RepID=UPI0040463F32
MKGKNKHNKLKPIMKKSMLAALGLGIALPFAGSLPHANATLPESNLVISEPVLNSGISWLSISSKRPMENSVPILVGLDNRITIDLSTHFPSSQYGSISAISSNENTASVDVINDDNTSYKLVVTPHARGRVEIELKAHYKLSEESNLESEIITDTIELHISKKGDFNNDGYVDSADAVELFSYLRNIQFGRSTSVSYVEMNKADIDRNGVPDKKNDMSAFMQGYIGGTLGAKNNSYVLTFKQKQDTPVVLNDSLMGEVNVNSNISTDVEVLNVDNNYNLHLSYQWYTSSDSSGTNKQIIPNATDSSYMISSAEAGKYLVLGVTPMVNPDDIQIDPFFIISKTHVPVPTPSPFPF